MTKSDDGLWGDQVAHGEPDGFQTDLMAVLWLDQLRVDFWDDLDQTGTLERLKRRRPREPAKRAKSTALQNPNLLGSIEARRQA